LVLIASDDTFVNADSACASKRRVGGSVTELDGLDHWWMLQHPFGAATLERSANLLG